VGAGGTILLPGEQGFEQRMHLQAEGVGFLGLKVNLLVHHHNFFPEQTGKKQTAPKSAESAAGKKNHSLSG
jgi:hypothetical protein